jgi:precorrin isomerase
MTTIYGIPITYVKDLETTRVGIRHQRKERLLHKENIHKTENLNVAEALEMLEKFLAGVDGKIKKGDTIMADSSLETLFKGCFIQKLN